MENNKINKEDYDAIPVTYCKQCLSLKILLVDGTIDYCDDCGSTDIATTDIHTWEKMYKEKYGKSYINNK